MSIQTDNFDVADLQPSKRILSVATASPKAHEMGVSEGSSWRCGRWQSKP